MKTKIRHSAFETNSSSSHSLVLDGETSYIQDSYFGDIVNDELIPTGKKEFGWEFEIWDSAADKLMYLCVDASRANDDIFMTKIEDLLIKKLNIKSIRWPFGSLNSSHYGIDHQSVGTTNSLYDGNNFDEDVIWNFLTNPNCQVRGGNDNEESPWE